MDIRVLPVLNFFISVHISTTSIVTHHFRRYYPKTLSTGVNRLNLKPCNWFFLSSDFSLVLFHNLSSSPLTHEILDTPSPIPHTRGKSSNSSPLSRSFPLLVRYATMPGKWGEVSF